MTTVTEDYEGQDVTLEDTREIVQDLDVTEFEDGERVETDGAALTLSEPVLRVVQIAATLGLPLTGMALVDLGEEYLIKNSFATTFNTGLYDSGTDALGESSDVGDITSEPGGAAYSRQSTATTALDSGGDWGVDNDSQESFDLSDSNSGSIDGWFWDVSFQADDTGDGSSQTHLILFGSLSQSYDVASVDTLNISAGSMTFTVS